MWAYIYHFLRAYKKCFFPYSVSYTEVTAEWKIADVHLPLMHYLRVTTLTRWTWYLCLFWASWTNLVCSLWLYIFLSCSSHLLFSPLFSRLRTEQRSQRFFWILRPCHQEPGGSTCGCHGYYLYAFFSLSFTRHAENGRQGGVSFWLDERESKKKAAAMHSMVSHELFLLFIF